LVSEKKRAYNKKWRLANLEKERERARKNAARKRARDPELANKKQRAWRAANPERVGQYSKTWKEAHPDRVKQTDLKIAQDGCCAICGTDTPGGRGRWHVDHCSKTNTVRRLLCSSCNPGLGFFKHDIALLQRAIDYLKEFG
jgi:Autographiviridae endonuclease VII